MTYDEAAKDYAQRLGDEQGPLLHRLVNESWFLHYFWAEYCVLFGSEPERIDVLNEAAGRFFGLIQDQLYESVLLGICRLTDPAVSAGKGDRRNLTVQALSTFAANHPKIDSAALTDRVRDALELSEFARDWRKRHIAHRDLRLAVGQGEALEPAPRVKVRAAIVAIHAAINEVHATVMDSSLYADFEPGEDGAEALLGVIREGLRERRARYARIEAGTASDADFDGAPARRNRHIRPGAE